jgi:hypothetical protein
MKAGTITILVAGLFVFFMFASCGASSVADKYVGYLDNVLSILGDKKIEPAKKGTEIMAFAEKNKAEIEKTLAALKALSAKDSEGIVDKIRTETNNVLDTVQSLAQTNPEIGSDENLLKSLQFFKVVGEQ